MMFDTDKISKWIFILYLFFYLLVVILDVTLVGFINYFIIPKIFHYFFSLFFLFLLYYIRPFNFYCRIFNIIQFGLSKLLTIFNDFIGMASDKFEFINYFLQKKRKFILLITIIFWLFALSSHFLSVIYNNPFFLSNNLFLATILITTMLIFFYKEYFEPYEKQELGSKSLLLLIIVLSVGLFLRIYNLGFLSPAGDEYRHLLAMKHYFTDGLFQYNASQVPNYILIFIKNFFNTNSLFFFRLPFSIIGLSSVFLFYLAGKKMFNVMVGVIAAYLYAVLPMAVGLSRYIREYEMAIFISLLFIYLFFTNIFRNIYIKFIALGLTIYLLSNILFDVRFNASLLLFLVFTSTYIVIQLICRLLKDKKTYDLMLYLFLTVFFLVGIYLIPKITGYNFIKEAELKYLFFINYYYEDTFWYFKSVPYTSIVLLIVLPLINKTNRNKALVLSLLFTCIFTAYVYIFYFNGPRRFQVRYLYFLAPYFIIFISSGISIFFDFLKRIFYKNNKKIYWVLSLSFLLIVFSPYKAFYFLFTEDNGQNNRMNQLAYFDAQKLQNFIKANNININKVLTTTPWILDYYYNEPFIKTEQELREYVHFPRGTNWYDFLDRTKIYSINGYWSEHDIKRVNKIISGKDIEYLIFAGHPKNPEFKYSYEFALKKIDNIEPFGVIDGDKTFGFYIYKIQKNS